MTFFRPLTVALLLAAFAVHSVDAQPTLIPLTKADVIRLSATRVPGSAVSDDADRSQACGVAQLPAEVRKTLLSVYGSWRAQELSDLSESARADWLDKQDKRRLRVGECPGTAIGPFVNTRMSYALLLVPKAQPDDAYTVLVFSTSDGQRSYRMTIVEHADRPGVASLTIRRVKVADYFDRRSRRQFRPLASEAIVLLESALNQYGAEMYFWTKSGFQQEPTELLPTDVGGFYGR